MSLKRKRFSEAASSSSSITNLKYEVFLSFRGDTRTNFTDHLYSALVNAGINTFRDDDELQRGKEISSELLKAIEQSKISIVVFSKGYASSRWCLDELVKIIDCKNTSDQIVIPIFYYVDPSDVRKQNGCYAAAFAQHEERFNAKMELVKKWREALTEAGNLSGYHLDNNANNGHESKFIQKIVKDVLRKVNHIPLHVATDPVGIEYRREKVMQLLSIGSPDVRIVGIYGMGGIGKTTIAKAVYNRIYEQFEGSSFLSDIKDESLKPGGPERKQEQLLSDILTGWKNTRINNIDRGIKLIKERLRNKRVLIVLDDLDESTLWEPLVRDREWLCPGSRILVTTRDEHFLTVLKVDERYKVEELYYGESIELFSRHAFGRPTPVDDFLQNSHSMVVLAQGLPLALQLWGSFLFGRSQPDWEDYLVTRSTY